MSSAGKVLSKGWRYAVYSGNFKKNLKFEDFSLPFTKSNGSALVRMQAAPVTNLDLSQIRGSTLAKVALPATAGCAGVGVVTDVSSGCKTLKSGDRVTFASAAVGTWASHQVANEEGLIKVPQNIPIEYASLLAVGPLVASSILKSSGLQKGQSLIVNGANTLIGMSVLQLAKHYGYNCVGVMQSSPGESELHLEKLKQMGLQVITDPVINAKEIFGNELPALAINLVGGLSAAHLAAALSDNGQIVTLGSSANDVHIFGNTDLVEKNLTVKGLSIFKWLKNTPRNELEQSVAEISDLVLANKLKLFVLRHELGNAQMAIADSQSLPYNVVLLHEGTEKTWPDSAREEYMKIDEQLQRNWDSAAAAQEPYLRSGREQPWTVPSIIADPALLASLPHELKEKLAKVETEEQFTTLLDSLSPSEKAALGVPQTQATSMTPEQLAEVVAALQKLK